MSDTKSKYRFTKPIDMPRSTHYGNNYWLFHSVKLDRRVTAFSNLEYYHLMTLEMDPEVEWYCEQPFEADVIDDTDEKLRHVVFDTYVYFRNEREEFREVKYSSDLEYPLPSIFGNKTEQSEDLERRRFEKVERARRQIRLETKWCADNHMDFQIMTEDKIITGNNYIQNLVSMQARLQRGKIKDKQLSEVLVGYLKGHPSSTVYSLIGAGILDRKAWLSQLAPLYYGGDITMRIKTNPLSYSTEVAEYGK